MSYLGTKPSNQTPTYKQVYEYTATAGQTTFTASYTVGFVSVFRNGVQLNSADYTATNGTSVVLANAASSGDAIRIESVFTANVQGAIPNAANAVVTSNINDFAVTTAKIADANITAAKIASGQVLPASGIAFPATQVASPDANTLDDYEEGSWTPSIAFDGGSTGITYSSNRVGIYTKIGNIVTVQAIVELTSKGSSTGTFTFITGLPFTTPSYNLYTGSAIGYTAGFVTNAPTAAYINPSATLLVLYNSSSGFIGSSNLSNTSVIGFQCTYRVA